MEFLNVLLLAFVLFSCAQKKDHQLIEVSKAEVTPTLDGVADEDCWHGAPWLPLDQRWLGDAYTAEDFSGRYKLTWDENALYLLVEITDDVLYDQHPDPLKFWWDEDCVEVFVDEDNSGGEHQFDHNAFAYHVALDGNVVDIGPNKEARLYNDHVNMKKKTHGQTTLWELKVKVFDDTYANGKDNKATILSEGKKVGFALAYCDNDASEHRENFIGSVFVPGEDKNRGWIDASIFGTLVLKE